MFEHRDHGIAVINDLIATTIDSADGYERSAENVEGTEFQPLFRHFARERRQLIDKLQAHIRLMGGAAEDKGSLSAGLHRRFEDLRAALAGNEGADRDKAVIAEVERGEDHLKAQYEKALKDDTLDEKCRAAITEAYESVRAGHDRMSQLKHSLQAS